jgi:RimJ/RimL family protein N-acetyltransferase
MTNVTMRPLDLGDYERIVRALPELSDERIRLRRWRSADAPAIVAAIADGSVAKWIVGMPWPYSDADARAFLKRARRDWATLTYIHLVITDAQTGRVVGAIGLNLHLDREAGEVGYWVVPGDRGQGIAPAAVALLARWAFEKLQLARLELVIHVDNQLSQTVAAKAGFSREGVLRSYLLHRGVRADYWLFSRLPSDAEPPSATSDSRPPIWAGVQHDPRTAGSEDPA